MKFNLGEEIIVSPESPRHAGKRGIFQFEAMSGKTPVAIIQDAKSNRQFMVYLEHVQKRERNDR